MQQDANHASDPFMWNFSFNNSIFDDIFGSFSRAGSKSQFGSDISVVLSVSFARYLLVFLSWKQLLAVRRL